MAKMFYTLQEAAEKLGLDEDQVKEMAAEGKLQQFRDRDKLMFKREQIDQMAGGSSSDSSADAGASGSGVIPLADDSAHDTDAIDLKDETHTAGQTQPGTQQGTSGGSSVGGSGVDVFESGELEPIDPGAQTQVTQSVEDDDNLALESVGSGSGLLDLTRESDDTSLGAAELLEEISSGGSTPGESAVGSGSVGSSGVFESAIAMEPGQSATTLESIGDEPTETVAGTRMEVTYSDEAYDPAGSGFGAGMLLGAMIALILGLIVVIGWIGGIQTPVAQMMAQSDMHLMIWSVGLLLGSIVLGVVGLVVGKAAAR
ncbi:helix-turn-helix domain-containing protein [Phycisphaerales bacterium AB-hyl4]|uniref:Helix-turn-helix domain-containing protein n=1 Tax=Natronomicrosphaera hydrolytica TaxID=3242702 RepID=A0ABV4TZP1_9BACT